MIFLQLIAVTTWISKYLIIWSFYNHLNPLYFQKTNPIPILKLDTIFFKFIPWSDIHKIGFYAFTLIHIEIICQLTRKCCFESILRKIFLAFPNITRVLLPVRQHLLSVLEKTNDCTDHESALQLSNHGWLWVKNYNANI